MSRGYPRIAGRGFATALVALLALLAAAAAEAQTTITVNRLNDPSSSRNCTLRDAIDVSQGIAISPDICATSGSGSPYTIVFSLGGTISLSSTLPTIVSPTNLTITGPNPASSASITIDGGGSVQLMIVNGGATLSLNSLTLTNGLSANRSYGGAIFNNGGTLNVANCTFTSNLVTAPQSTFSAFGGAIENDGTLSVTGSTFSGNTAKGTYAYGGAIENGGTFEIPGVATITNSTFSGNQAQGFAGAGGGALSDYGGGTFTLTNVTFSGNGISSSQFGAGGAISNLAYNNPATVNLKGTIIANSTGGNCYNSAGGSINDNGYNIADDTENSCDLDTTSPGTSQIITPTSAIGLAPALGANGGPTQTIALNGTPANTFIPALDCTDQSGNPLTTDQRGYGRPVAGTCSAGAYQYLGIDCSNAAASTPNLTSVPFVFYPESITGVSNKFKISITDVEQSGPIINFPPLFCPNAQIVGSMAFVRASTQSLTGDMLYSIGFEATDKTTGATCTGSVPVCVQNLLNAGKPCTGTATYDATSYR